MRRISQDDIEHRIYVTIRTFPKHLRKQLVDPLPHKADAATAKLAEAIAERIAGGEFRVIAPDRLRTKDSGEQLGKWSEGDPDPTAGL